MGKIDELIQQYCPDGVEWKKIEEVCKVKTPPAKLKTSDYQEQGLFLIIDQGQQQYAGYTDNEKAVVEEGEYILYGDHTCIVKYHKGRFAQGADGLKILVSKANNPKYVYYAFSAYNLTSTEYKRHWTQAKEIEIPLPPLPVQEAIVNILDRFTVYAAELQAELQARQQQYNYYRDTLLSFEGRDDVQWKKLGEVCDNLDRKRKPITASNRIAGAIPYYGASGIVDYVKDYIFDGDFLLVSEDGANLLTRTYPIAFSIHGKTWVNNHAHILQFEERATRKYVEYYLNSIDLSLWISAGAQPKLTQDNLNKIPIPVPVLSEQQRIVDILDRFDTLVNDLSQGLPAEIEARQQQYEYYRDQLLTFKRNEA